MNWILSFFKIILTLFCCLNSISVAEEGWYENNQRKC